MINVLESVIITYMYTCASIKFVYHDHDSNNYFIFYSYLLVWNYVCVL